MSRTYEANQHAVHKWMRTLKKQWSELMEQALAKRNKINAAMAIKQVDGLLQMIWMDGWIHPDHGWICSV